MLHVSVKTVRRRPHRQLTIGDMRHRIELHDRELTAPGEGEVDFDHDFAPFAKPWASVRTVTGKTHFDGVATETPITHAFAMRKRSAGRATAETWVIWKGQRYDVLDVENLDERGEFVELMTASKGSVDMAGSQS